MSTPAASALATSASAVSVQPIKLEDTLGDLIEFCLKVRSSQQGVLSSNVDSISARIKRFELAFNKKKDGPNNMKKMISEIYSKCKSQIAEIEDDDVDKIKEFLLWLSKQNFTIKPREDGEKTCSIPISMICNDCIKIAAEDEEQETIHEMFLLHFLRVMNFVTSKNSPEEEHIDKIISSLENLLGLDPDESPDVASFFIHLMDKVTDKLGGKEVSAGIKKFFKGQMKREDRKKYEDTVLNVAEKLVGKMPKPGENIDFNNIGSMVNNTTQEMMKELAVAGINNNTNNSGTGSSSSNTTSTNDTLLPNIFGMNSNNNDLPPGILEAQRATSLN